ncbi:hypothetical protein M427DRAFT_46562 [Gonapodya prolifera JEL478]|uniref:Uncharacterized protein n=1 Tax=Gonapodya prolifera (strain JEL478) TaxID=1344416 RepID=A0A139A666_GONPJ|nr:hypothetical protein M427DRAFT_46562 [Gonapodya prolifera JEL478]|eukprot:KXS12148.1 hypothetical protein M427DRAFT_46562 [Gonapodya prolifera JEL478]
MQRKTFQAREMTCSAAALRLGFVAQTWNENQISVQPANRVAEDAGQVEKYGLYCSEVHVSKNGEVWEEFQYTHAPLWIASDVERPFLLVFRAIFRALLADKVKTPTADSRMEGNEVQFNSTSPSSIVRRDRRDMKERTHGASTISTLKWTPSQLSGTRTEVFQSRDTRRAVEYMNRRGRLPKMETSSSAGRRDAIIAWSRLKLGRVANNRFSFVSQRKAEVWNTIECFWLLLRYSYTLASIVTQVIWAAGGTPVGFWSHRQCAPHGDLDG